MRAANYIGNSGRHGGERTILPGIILMALTSIIAIFVVSAASGIFSAYPNLYLLPWLTGLAIVMVIPLCILFYRGNLSFADPLVFATCSYFFPAFVIGGLFFAVGLSQPYFIAFTEDPTYNLPLTVVLVALGFTALAVGYFLPVGARIGGWIESRLPKASSEPSDYIGPGIALLILGVFNTIFAFILGVFGYQRAEEITQYDGLIYLTTLFWMEGSFLLWNVVFRTRQMTVMNVIVIILLVATALSKILFAGNRGSVIQVFSIVALAYVLSGREFKFKHTVIAGVTITVMIIAGMIYGTTFRNVKGGESRQDFSQYTDNVWRTFDQIGKNDSLVNLQSGFSNLTERIDILTTLSVVVSNHEQLAPYEEAYGLDNNIWKDMTTFMVPRAIWKEKPYSSDPRKYSDLYFNQSDTSFAITPMGDLLRNYGLIGIPIGMLLIGIIIRMIYRALVELQPSSIWRSMFYFMLLTSISYEGFYGTIIPTLFKVGLTALVGVVIVVMLSKIDILPRRMSLPTLAK